MNSESIPRMTQTYISSMMVFKDYLTQKCKRESVKACPVQWDDVEELLEANKNRQLFAAKYNTFVDRIYGKNGKDRRALETAMTMFKEKHNSQSDKKLLNHQELMLLEEFEAASRKQLQNEKLLMKISSDFVKEATRDVETFDKNKLKESHKLHNKIFKHISQNFYQHSSQKLNFQNIIAKQDTHYSPEYFKVLHTTPSDPKLAQDTDKEKLLKAFRKRPLHLQSLSHQQSPLHRKLEMKAQCLKQVKQLLEIKDLKEKTFEQHLCHERDYLGGTQEKMSDIYYMASLKKAAQKLCKFKDQAKEKKKKELKELKELKEEVKEEQEEGENLNKYLVRFHQDCKDEQRKCKRIIKKCRTQKSRFDSKYGSLQGSCNKYIS